MQSGHLAICKLPEEAQNLMGLAMSQLNLSARAYHRILKLARTIVDLMGCEEIQTVHLAEVKQNRPKLMMGQHSFDIQFTLCKFLLRMLFHK